MHFLKVCKKNIVMLPEDMFTNGFIGAIYGKYYEETGVFNVIDSVAAAALPVEHIGE
jgi:hypothetical protein